MGTLPFSARLVLSLICVSGLCGCAPSAAPDETPVERESEALSLLGRPLVAPELSAEFRNEQERLLGLARADLEKRPGDADALIWVGRRTAYLGRYREAIGIYSTGIETHPLDARFLRHRGHRYLSTRRLQEAVEDLERAAAMIHGREDQVEPDGLPNAANIPTSTLQSNIWYHLGLARYLLDDLEGALEAYRQCLAVSANPDMLSATTHWLYMTLRRLGREDQALAALTPIHAEMEILENRDYHRLLLMYRGERDAETLLSQAVEGQTGVGYASTAYGIGNWYRVNGDEERAREIFADILATDSWAAFGYIAAEADLTRAQR